jgi:hypothetical protein
MRAEEYKCFLEDFSTKNTVAGKGRFAEASRLPDASAKRR